MVCKHCAPQLRIDSGNGWTCFNGPAAVAMGEIESDSIDAIVSDPPYGTGANSTAGRLAPSSKKYRSTGAKPLPDIDGDAMLPEAWREMMNQVLQECFRVAKPGAELLWFCDWRSVSQMLSLIGGARFGLRSVIVWNKGRKARPMPNGFRNQSEFIVHARKPGKLDRSQNVYLDGVITHNTLSNGKQHLTQKPLPLMRELLQIVPGGKVLDPFQGSGTTGVAAIERGLMYIGIESVRDYHDIAVSRLNAE